MNMAPFRTRHTCYTAHLIAVMITISLSVGCIHKQSGPVTPWEKVTTSNAILAQGINTLAHGVIDVQTSGLITRSQARPILEFTKTASVDQQQLNRILEKAPDASNLPAIQALVLQIGASGQALVNSGGVGVKNPRSQQSISADIQAVVDSANLILTAYQAALGGAH